MDEVWDIVPLVSSFGTAGDERIEARDAELWKRERETDREGAKEKERDGYTGKKKLVATSIGEIDSR